MTYGGLFEGIGMFAYAAQKAGLNPIWSNEIDPYCCNVLRKNFNHKILECDIRNINANELEKVDIICGGFPCTDISHAGKRAGITGKSSGLWSEQYRIISQVHPRFCIIENSSSLTKNGLWKILYDLAKIGYDAEWSVIPASLYGLPHQRSRVFILAYPNIQRRRGYLHIITERRKKGTLSPVMQIVDPRCDSFLQFQKITGKPAVFRMDDEHPFELDKAEIKEFRHRLSAIGNAIVWNIAYDIINEIIVNPN